MNFEYMHMLPESFNKESRVWIYQSTRPFNTRESLDIEISIKNFTNNWQSHGNDVKAFGNLFFDYFLILIADETKAGVTGCSTDSSVHFVKELGLKYQVDFFDRNNLAFIMDDQVQLLALNQLQSAFEKNFINAETAYFNNIVQTKIELETSWIIPIKQSWLAERLKSLQY